MSSRIINVVLAVAIVGVFAYFVAQYAVDVKHSLQKQITHIVQLKTEGATLDKKLNKTQETKEQTKQQVQQLDQATQDAINQRLELEAQLGAN
jgi:cell division protein FtsB